MNEMDLKLSVESGKNKLIEGLKSIRNSREESDAGFIGYVNQLLKSELLKEGTAAHGIALMISKEGISNVTDSQLTTFVKYGLNQDNYRHQCPVCLEELTFDDIFNTMDNGMCSNCNYKLEKS